MTQQDVTGAHPAAPFHPIGKLTNRRFLSLDPTATAQQALRELAALPDDAVGTHAAVIAPGNRYLGLVSLRDCLRAAPDTEVIRLADTKLPRAADDWSAEAGAAELSDGGFGCLPVMDSGGHLLGLITAQEASRYLFDEIERDTNRSIGILDNAQQDEHDYLDRSILSDYMRRMPWVLGLAVAGLAAGYVVHIYEDALDALVILALYMPMVADTGGNVGTQSASLVTRALAFGEVRRPDVLRVLWREARVALMMAATLALFAYLKVWLISNATDAPTGLSLGQIGLAIALALAAQVVSATLIGAALPMAAVAMRQDPALISGPALTTIVDFTGLILYFSITTRMLGIG